MKVKNENRPREPKLAGAVIFRSMDVFDCVGFNRPSTGCHPREVNGPERQSLATAAG